MKSLKEQISLASMAVARTGIDRVIIKVGNNYANLLSDLHKGPKYELKLTRKNKKVLVHDFTGKKVDEIEITPRKPQSNTQEAKSDKSDKKGSEKERGEKASK